MKEERPPIQIVDITGKKQIECPHCGFTLKIPPRTISMEKLEHIQLVEKFAELRKKSMPLGHHGAGNVRLLVCPNCGNPTFCTDEFSVHV